MNAQYSSRDTTDIIGIPLPIKDEDLKQKMRNTFGEIRVYVAENDIQAFHRIREKERKIVKLVSRKDSANISSIKKGS